MYNFYVFQNSFDVTVSTIYVVKNVSRNDEPKQKGFFDFVHKTVFSF